MTGQSGTNIYELKYWLKADYYWHGIVYTGKIVNKQFIISKALQGNSEDWEFYTLTDTITTEETDPIAVRLTADMCDFCMLSARFDMIELNQVGTITSCNPNDNLTLSKITAYPNPSSDYVKVEFRNAKREKRRLSVYDLLGNEVKVIESTDDDIYIFKTEIGTGVYFFHLQSAADKSERGMGKFVFQ